jgi:hypothetical protein
MIPEKEITITMATEHRGEKTGELFFNFVFVFILFGSLIFACFGSCVLRTCLFHHFFSCRKKDESRGMHAIKNEKSSSGAGGAPGAKDNRVYSCTPIFIQQDLYCISTKSASEHRTWPMRSTAIINHSKNISRETALEYRTAYRESAVVKNALQVRMNAKGNGRLYDDDELPEDHAHANGAGTGGASGGGGSGNGSGEGGNSNHNGGGSGGAGMGAGAGTGTGNGAHKEDGSSGEGGGGGNGNGNGSGGNGGQHAEHSMSCLRKVVHRGPPYDFAVDRRCVWKFCLFEQFSDNNITLSEKDKAAKRVMETATMAMKLSQLNREGAHTHIQNHTYGEDLPPLKSGESFVRTLREINFKTSLKLEQQYLQMRRAKEARLKEHFARHMTEVRTMEKIDQFEIDRRATNFKFKSPKVKTDGSLSGSTSFMTQSDEYEDSDYGSSASSPYKSGENANIPNLMAKTNQRRTSFLIDSLPKNVGIAASASGKYDGNSMNSSGSFMGSPTHQHQQNSLGSNSAYANSPFSPGSSSHASGGGRKAFTFLPKAVEASNANYAAGKVFSFGVVLYIYII